MSYNLNITVIAQSAPDYNVRLKCEFWRVRDSAWQGYFVSMAKIIKGKVVHCYVPILTEEYRTNPTKWPKGRIG